MRTRFLVSLLLSLFSFSSLAIDTGEGIILPDGSIVIADVFLDQDIFQPAQRPKRIALNPRLSLQTRIYAKYLDNRASRVSLTEKTWIDSDWIEVDSEKNRKDLYFYVVPDVEKLRYYCAPGRGKTYKVMGHASVNEYACTSGNETFFVEEKFRSLSLKEQALLLMHERMTAKRDKNLGRNFPVIGNTLNTFSALIEIRMEHQSGVLRKLTQAEFLNLKTFYSEVFELAKFYHPYSELKSTELIPTQNGGGLVSKDLEIQPGALVDLDSRIYAKGTLFPESRVLNSTIFGELNLREGASISNSVFQNRRNSDIFLDIGENSIISESEISSEHFEVGADAKIERSRIALSLRAGVSLVLSLSELVIGSSNEKPTVYQLGNNQSLRRGKIVSSHSSYGVPQGYEVRPIILNIPGMKTPCFELAQEELKESSLHCRYGTYRGGESMHDRFLSARNFNTGDVVGSVTPSSTRRFQDKHKLYSAIDTFDVSFKLLPNRGDTRGIGEFMIHEEQILKVVSFKRYVYRSYELHMPDWFSFSNLGALAAEYGAVLEHSRIIFPLHKATE